MNIHDSYSFNAGGSRAESPCEVGNSFLSFGDTSTVTFTGNNAKYLGGAIYVNNSRITFHGHSTVTFIKNHAGSGGAIEIYNFEFYEFFILFGENSTVTFTENSADVGGAVHSHNTAICFLWTLKCNISFYRHSTVNFRRNHAGGEELLK